MSDPVIRLNAALEGRYAIERELGEGGMATSVSSPEVRQPLPATGVDRQLAPHDQADPSRCR